VVRIVIKNRFTLVSTKMNWLCITVGDFRTGTMERTVCRGYGVVLEPSRKPKD